MESSVKSFHDTGFDFIQRIAGMCFKDFFLPEIYGGYIIVVVFIGIICFFRLIDPFYQNVVVVRILLLELCDCLFRLAYLFSFRFIAFKLRYGLAVPHRQHG